MIVERFFTPELAQVAYAVGNQATRQVALIDPRRDVGEYVEWARRRGVTIVAILETHVHADFVSGAPELAGATGAKVYTSRLGRQEFDHIPVDDGWSLDIGTTRLTALHTPGHTPEHMSWLVDDTRYPEAARVLFSGDALFVGDVGRPDLLGAGQTGALVENLYHTVNNVLRNLPNDTMVYPGHTAGSSCGKNIGSDPHTTIGREKATNYAFQPRTLSAFSDAVMRDMPTPPTYYPVLKKMNTLGARSLSSVPEMRSLPPGMLEDHAAAGAMVVDVRAPDQFAAGHIPGSVFVGVGTSFATWMGWLAPYDRDVVLVTDDVMQAKQALTMLHRIGIDRVVGYHVGMNAWQESGRTIATLRTTEPDAVMSEMDIRNEPVVLDVRNSAEFEMGHVDGAVHHFLGSITQGSMPQIDRNTDVVVMCASGYRSTVAASLMQANGFERLRNMTGGMNAWMERKAGIRSIAS